MAPARTALVARDVMHTHPMTVAADTPFLELQHLFVATQVGGAPVVDGDGKVIGVISIVDLLRTVDQVCDDELDVGPGGPELGERLERWTAEMVATPEPVWVAPDAPIARVARVMRKHGIHRVLVGSHGQLDGIITSFDLLALLDGTRRHPAGSHRTAVRH